MQSYSTGARRSTEPANGSFAERAKGTHGYDYDNEDLYGTEVPAARTSTTHDRPHRQNSKAYRTREPQAALHVPQSGRYPMEETWTGPTLPKDPHGPDTVKKPVARARPDSPTLDTAVNSTPANRSQRASVQERSPLQRLEGRLDSMTKEEKRARMEAAEQRAAQRAQNKHLSVEHAGSRRHAPDTSKALPSRPSAKSSSGRRNVSDPIPNRSVKEARVNDRRDDGARVQQGIPSDPARRRSQLYANSAMDAAYAAATADGGVLADAPPRTSSTRHSTGGPARRRSTGKRLQKKEPEPNYVTGGRDPANMPIAQTSLQSARAGGEKRSERATGTTNNDPLPADAVRIPDSHGPNYQVPPQTAASVQARDRVNATFANEQRAPPTNKPTSRRQYVNALPPFRADEFRSAETAKLELDDLALDAAITRSNRNSHTDSTLGRKGSKRHTSANYQGALGDSQGYQPALYVRCGPLLRYTGMRRERKVQRASGTPIEREIWRGSVMIVTSDLQSDYSTVPILRLFAQPMDLLPPPPTHHKEELSAEYVDPVAGQVKASRIGQAMYVKPIEAIPEAVDLSQDESENGLFESYCSSVNKSRLRSHDGEKLGRFKEVKGSRLHVERGLTFWRFNIEVELGISQARIAYRINEGPATGFWVPARGSTMNIMFHSCNGFSLSVDSDTFSGPDPLWRDVLNSHAIKPYHVMLGGGDQVYNDRVMRDTKHFAEWLQIKNAERKHHADFTKEMQDELESFYLNRYAMWFSQGLFGVANSQIPMVNQWDDHDIIDGFGSYPHHFMSSKVFTGLGTVAFKYYMLFQHQSVPAETYHDEPSWLLGASPGPYIHYPSRNTFMFLGRRVAFLGLDCRTERARDEILCQGTYDQIFHRCRAEIIKGETKHLIVMLTVPIAYPRLNFLENVLTSRAMDPIKALGRTGALGGFVNKFDGGVEILDDLDDHWTAKHHKQERNWFIQELQELAAEKSIRITILGGDVHLAAIGQFYTRKALGVPKDKDHRYMPNVISSAIVNTPPPVVMSDVLNRRNKVHHLDHDTDEDMIPMFPHDVDGKSRNNKTLLPRRNYCTIREYMPGHTPPHTPTEEEPSVIEDEPMIDQYRRRYPPGSMGRSRSLTREDFRPKNIIRRLSGSRERKPEEEEGKRRFSFTNTPRRFKDDNDDSYFTQRPSSAHGRDDLAGQPGAIAPVRPTGSFRRRLSEPSRKQVDFEHSDDEHGSNHPDDINLEHGLDICLNMEISQHDPSGATVPYRLLVPALHYSGPQDANATRFRTRRASLLNRIRGRTASQRRRGDDASDSDSISGTSHSPSRPVQHDIRPVSGHRATHPDDRLQFADTAATGGLVAGAAAANAKDDRRDSHNTDPAGAAPARADYGTHAYGQHHTVRPGSRDKQTRFAEGHNPGEDEQLSDGESYDYRPKRRSTLLEGLRRRFSRRGRYEDESFSGSDVGSDDEHLSTGYGPDGRMSGHTADGMNGPQTTEHSSGTAHQRSAHDPRNTVHHQDGSRRSSTRPMESTTQPPHRYPSIGHANAARRQQEQAQQQQQQRQLGQPRPAAHSHQQQQQQRPQAQHPASAPSEGFSDPSDDGMYDDDDVSSYDTRHMGAMERVRRFLGGKGRARRRSAGEWSDDDYSDQEQDGPDAAGQVHNAYAGQVVDRHAQGQQAYARQDPRREHALDGAAEPQRRVGKADRLLGRTGRDGHLGAGGQGGANGDIGGRGGLVGYEHEGYVGGYQDGAGGHPDGFEGRKGYADEKAGRRRSWQVWKR